VELGGIEPPTSTVQV